MPQNACAMRLCCDAAALRTTAIRAGNGDPRLWASDYPGTIIPLPAEEWDLPDAIQVSGHPELWSVTIALGLTPEGRR